MRFISFFPSIVFVVFALVSPGLAVPAPYYAPCHTTTGFGVTGPPFTETSIEGSTSSFDTFTQTAIGTSTFCDIVTITETVTEVTTITEAETTRFQGTFTAATESCTCEADTTSRNQG